MFSRIYKASRAFRKILLATAGTVLFARPPVADTQENRVVPENRSAVQACAPVRFRLILYFQSFTITGTCNTKADIVVLVSRIVVVAVGRGQVVRIVVPRTATQTAPNSRLNPGFPSMRG
ncbi:hypothetical protein J7L67_07735 [bacterium]|nr:hypothetical protein [bacterium]